MQPLDFDEILDQIVSKQDRYDREAYVFVREALDYTQRLISKGDPKKMRHVSGQELLDGIRRYALKQYGPMTRTLLAEWGVFECEDFGRLVFNLIEHNILARTDRDELDDFSGGYDFIQAFDQPFLPANKTLKPRKAGKA